MIKVSYMILKATKSLMENNVLWAIETTFYVFYNFLMKTLNRNNFNLKNIEQNF